MIVFRSFVGANGSEYTRCYALGPKDKGSKDHTLLHVDITHAMLTHLSKLEPPTLLWKPLLASANYKIGLKPLSKEEQLLRERSRCIASGITSYEYNQDANLFLFVSGGVLFKAVDEYGESGTPGLVAISPHLVRHNVIPEDPFGLPGAPLQPSTCPYRPDVTAFVADDDVWINFDPSNTSSTQAEYSLRATHEHLRCSAMSAGVPSFVTQEEFDRYNGVWWQPRQTQANEAILLYEISDSRQVPEVTITIPATTSEPSERMRYPKVGEPNAKSSLHLLRISLDDTGSSTNKIESYSLDKALLELFDWAEYIVRAGWTPDGTAVWAQLLSRLHDRIALIHIPITAFTVSTTSSIHHEKDLDRKGSSIPNVISPNGAASAPDFSHAKAEASILIDEHCNVEKCGWIDVSEHLTFVDTGDVQTQPIPSKELTFLWSSDRDTGFRHLYKIKVELPTSSTETEDELRQAKTVAIQQLTSGDWIVPAKNELVIDHDAQMVYFVGSKDTPLETHLYRTSFGNIDSSKSRIIDRMTPLGQSNLTQRGGEAICLSNPLSIPKTYQLLVNVSCSTTKPLTCTITSIPPPSGADIPTSTVAKLDTNPKPSLADVIAGELQGKHHTIGFCDSVEVSMDDPIGAHVHPADSGHDTPIVEMRPGAPPPPKLFAAALEDFSNGGASKGTVEDNGNNVAEQNSSIGSPEIISFVNPKTGVEHYAMIVKPLGWERGVVYPTILNVYAGPEVQLVRNINYGRLGYQRATALGYAMVWIDGRGSANRGKGFECSIKHQMGSVEIEDQLDCIQIVAERTGVVDLSRLAIRGWSYGGYASLAALMQRPDLIRCAVAGGPVTAWELYDTGYTERYMGLPQLAPGVTSVNPTGYNLGRLYDKADKFPDEPGRLLLFHGLIDENVHFTHTTHLLDALMRAGKPHELHIFPSERHGVRTPSSFEFMETLVLWWLQTNLAPRKLPSSLL